MTHSLLNSSRPGPEFIFLTVMPFSSDLPPPHVTFLDGESEVNGSVATWKDIAHLARAEDLDRISRWSLGAGVFVLNESFGKKAAYISGGTRSLNGQLLTHTAQLRSAVSLVVFTKG